MDGSGCDLELPDRHTSYFLFTPNDFDYAVRAIIVDQEPLPADGLLFTVTFDSCDGIPVPPASDFGCIVEACAGAGGSIAGCTCDVTAP